MPFDLTVILNPHRGHTFLVRTLLSLEESALFAQHLGITIELAIVLDRPDDATRDIAKRAAPSGFSHIQVVEVDNGSLGLSRNAGAAIAQGEWLLMHDEDDLLSFNALAGLFFSAVRHGPRSIHVCDTLVAFGTNAFIVSYFGSEFVTPIAFVDTHPYVSRILCHRTLFDEQQFSDVRLTRGYAYEDWFFNAEALAKGYTFHAAKDTIFFYRQREGLLQQMNAISSRQIPPTSLLDPPTFLRLGADGYERFKTNGALCDRIEPRDRILERPVIFEGFVAANRIEPQLNWAAFEACQQYTNLSFCNPGIGIAYYEICRTVGRKKFDDVFLLPFFGAGGAERYFLDIIDGLNRIYSNNPMLVVLGENGYKSNWVNRFPANVTVIDFSTLCPDLNEDARTLLALKTIEATASHARVHLKPSPFCQSFARRYFRLLINCTRIYYRFSDSRSHIRGREFTEPYGFELVSSMIEEIDLVVADNGKVIEEDRRRLGVYKDRWKLLYARQVPRVQQEQVPMLVEDALPNIVWASRLDQQKRPQLLRLIATRLQERAGHLVLHVFGKPVFSTFPSNSFDDLPNVRMHGEFDRFEEVLAVQPMCFLFTSIFEGVPIVLLEAAASGLPIIAPDVGGIAEFVSNGVTGVLLESLSSDEKMADIMVDAIIGLWENPIWRKSLAVGALEKLVAQHGDQAFQARIEGLLLPQRGSVNSPY